MSPLVLFLFFILVLLIGVDNYQDWEKIEDKDNKINELVKQLEKTKRWRNDRK